MDRIDEIFAEHQRRMDEIHAKFEQDMKEAYEPFVEAYTKLMAIGAGIAGVCVLIYLSI